MSTWKKTYEERKGEGVDPWAIFIYGKPWAIFIFMGNLYSLWAIFNIYGQSLLR
jgi:hypothetical protein